MLLIALGLLLLIIGLNILLYKLARRRRMSVDKEGRLSDYNEGEEAPDDEFSYGWHKDIWH